MQTVATFFESEEKILFHQVEKFYEILTHFRYEGKVCRGKNLKAVRGAIQELTSKLRAHKTLQEKIIFPFLKKHIPRQEAVAHVLETEHEDIAVSQRSLKVSLSKLSKNSDDHAAAGAAYQTGIYLVALLRHHLKFEKKILHQSLLKELLKQEKREVSTRIEGWLHNQKNNGEGAQRGRKYGKVANS